MNTNVYITATKGFIVKDGEKTAAKLFEVIECSAKYAEGTDAHTISEQTGIPLSTVFRLLKFLCGKNCMRNSGGRYTLGPGFVRLGAIASAQNPLMRSAHPILAELSRETMETVHLAEFRDDRIVYVDKVEGIRPVRMVSLIGSSGPLYCTGVGKAILACLEPAHVERLCADIEFIPYTRNTITDFACLQKELSAIRRRGYAVDDCEHEDGVYCIAAAVLDYAGHPVAAVSISGAALYLKNKRALLARLVCHAAEQLSTPKN